MSETDTSLAAAAAASAPAKPRPRPVARSTMQPPGAKPPGVPDAPIMPRRVENAVSGDGDPATPPVRPGFVRKPFGAHRQQLSAPARPGYHRHWFNDVGDRIKDAKDAGYEHVKENGKPKKKAVGVMQGGGAMHAFLMETPIEWYQEDMAAQQKEVDEIDDAIRGGDIARKENDKRYVPDKRGNPAIKIETD